MRLKSCQDVVPETRLTGYTAKTRHQSGSTFVNDLDSNGMCVYSQPLVYSILSFCACMCSHNPEGSSSGYITHTPALPNIYGYITLI